MANELNIKLGADVNDAIRGLQQVEQQSSRTFQKVSQSSGAATQSLVNLSRVAQDAPYGFIGIANNLNPLVESFQRLKVETGTTGGAFKALGAALSGPAGIGLAVGIASSLLVKFGDSLFGAGEASKKLAEQAKKVAEQQKAIADSIAQENARVSVLVGQLNRENISRAEKETLLKRLRQVAPAYFNDLKNEEGLINNVNSAYDKYLSGLVRRTEAAILTKDLEELSTQIIELEKKGAVRVSQLPTGIGFDENRKITQENLKQLALATEYDGLLRQRNQLLAQIVSKSDLPADPFIPKKGKLAKGFKDVFELEFASLQIDFAKTFDTDQATRDGAILGQSFLDGVNKALQTGEGVSQSNIKFKKFVSDYESLKEAIAANNQLIADSITSTFVGAFNQLFSALKSGENAFRAFGQSVGNALLGVVEKIVATAAAAAVLSFIFPGGVGGAVGFKNIFGSLIGFRANGGPVSSQSPYIVGERGPELFVPSVSGRVVPNNQMGSFNGRSSFATGGGGRSIVRGTDILLASARTQRSISRVNA
jgi:hypothetical protein